MSTQPSIPPGYVNRVPAWLAGVKAGYAHLCWLAGNTVWSRMASDTPYSVAVRWCSMNSYTSFTFTFTDRVTNKSKVPCFYGPHIYVNFCSPGCMYWFGNCCGRSLILGTSLSCSNARQIGCWRKTNNVCVCACDCILVCFCCYSYCYQPSKQHIWISSVKKCQCQRTADVPLWLVIMVACMLSLAILFLYVHPIISWNSYAQNCVRIRFVWLFQSVSKQMIATADFGLL